MVKRSLVLVLVLLVTGCTATQAPHGTGARKEIPESARKREASVPRHPEDHQKIDEHMRRVDSKDRQVRYRAIKELGYWQRKDASDLLTGLLRRNLEGDLGWDSGFLCTGGEEFRAHVDVPPENLVISSTLAHQGHFGALPLLRRVYDHLMHQPQEARSPEYCLAMAGHIYSLSAERVPYWDGQKLSDYRPYPIQVETTRRLLRPDLEPTNGLTATLDLPVTGRSGFSLLGSRPAKLSLRITNHTDEPIPVDLTPSSLVFSIVATGSRHEISAALLPKPINTALADSVPPRQSVEVTWEIQRLKESAFHDVLGTGGFYIKGVYRPVQEPMRSEWQGERLETDTLSREYFSRE